ncbi:S-layer protein [Chitinispirillum alkaliphilum]|nr:S-layer protein [Chitinispirillum alkaliphilum]
MAEGHMDTPETHYRQGMRYWNDGDYKRAEEHFKLAESLDRRFAPAVAGLALTTAKNAQQASEVRESENLFRDAHRLADRAKRLDRRTPEPWIAKALVISMEHEGEELGRWFRSMEREFEGALNVDPDNPEVYYHRGLAYKRTFQFTKAGNDFRKIIELNTRFVGAADREWQQIQMIERAAPGTQVGKQIALVDRISRADIAALFISELRIDRLISRRGHRNYDTHFQAPEDPRAMEVNQIITKDKVTDLDGHWARNFIMDIVDLQIRGLEPYPDRTFKPNELITRGEYAMMVEDVIISIMGDPSMATMHIGTQSRFPDVNPSHPAYNAICNAVDRGIMSAEMNGEFGLQRHVSGPEALLVIRNLQELNRVE